MSSLVEMQYQQHFPQQQFQPLSLELMQKQQEQQKSEQPKQQSYLAAVSGNNYATQHTTRRRKKRKQQQQQQHRRHMQPAAMQAYRQLAVAATNNNNNYGPPHISGGSYTSYGSAPSGGEYPPSNVDYSSYAGYGEVPQHQQQHQSHPPVYGPPQQPVHHVPSYKPIKTMNKKKKGDATLSALTLLSFFFFVNLLQSCLKDHMNTVNPTVMVMTVNGVRNRFNKLAEINSREQNAAAAATSSSTFIANPQNSPQVVALNTNDLIAVADSSQHVVPSIMLAQSPYSNNNNNNNNHNKNDIGSNKLISIGTQEYNYNNNNKNDNKNNAYSYKQHNIKTNAGNQQQLGHQHASSFSNQSPRPEFYDSVHSYSNRNYSSLFYPHDISTSPGNVFSSTYIRSKSLDKSQNYSSHEKIPVHQIHGEWDREQSRDIDHYSRPSHLENTYFSSLRSTASPTSYWTLAAKTSSAADILQHHDDDDIDHRYIGKR